MRVQGEEPRGQPHQPAGAAHEDAGGQSRGALGAVQAREGPRRHAPLSDAAQDGGGETEERKCEAEMRNFAVFISCLAKTSSQNRRWRLKL